MVTSCETGRSSLDVPTGQALSPRGSITRTRAISVRVSTAAGRGLASKSKVAAVRAARVVRKTLSSMHRGVRTSINKVLSKARHEIGKMVSRHKKAAPVPDTPELARLPSLGRSMSHEGLMEVVADA